MSIGALDSREHGEPGSDASGVTDPLRGVLETALGAQYSVIRLLGRGGMGAVYLARERLLERLVAIKVLPREYADAEARERFLREARTAALLNHPNIVPLLSFGEMGDTLFYIMRYVEGESLEARLRRDGVLPSAETRRILSELSDALGYAHEQGVVHRDIKPDNVLIEYGSGRVMLTDFGVARRASATATLTSTGMIVGTPQYMSPEQASGERVVDGRSDLYGMGVIGYRMLTGQLPFVGESARELLIQHITETPRHVGELAPEVPHDLATAVMKCLAKEPSERWADAASMRQAIAASAVGEVALPDELEGLPRLGTRMAGWGYAFLGAMTLIRLFDADPIWMRLGIWGPILGLALAIGSPVIAASRHGISWREALRMAFWPPQGWSGWWPKRLRPPGDVWTRLPVVVRRARAWGMTALALSFGAVALPALGVFLVWADPIRQWSPLAKHALFTAWMASALTPMLSLIASYVVVGRFGRGFGLSKPEIIRLMTEPTTGSRFWERVSIARLLTQEHPVPQAPGTEAELVAAVRELARALAPAMETMASEAVQAADDLFSAIRALDRQQADLGDPADAGEQRRIEDRLAALGATHPDEPAPRRQMRTLLEGQLALLRDIANRREALLQRRTMLHEQLKTLWLQIANLRAQAAAPSADSSELSGRIRALCRGIEQRVAAIDETDRLIRP